MPLTPISQEDRTLVERGLARLAAASPDLPAGFTPNLERAARRATALRRGSIAVAALVVAALVAGPGLHLTTGSAAQNAGSGNSSVLTWGARGPLAHDSGLTQEVQASWWRDARMSVRGLTVLYAGPVDGTRFVVAAGTDTAGATHVGFFSTAAPHGQPEGDATTSGTLWLRGANTVSAAPAAISIATDRLGDGLGVETANRDVVAFVLGAPGTTGISIQSTTVDDSMGRSDRDSDWQTLFPQSLAFTDSTTVWDDSGHVLTLPVDTAGVGDRFTSAAVTDAPADTSNGFTINVGTQAGVRTGDQVAAPAGLLGTVRSVTAQTASVSPIVSPGFTVKVSAGFGGLTGTVTARSDGLWFTSDQQPVNPTITRLSTVGPRPVTVGYYTGPTTPLRVSTSVTANEPVTVLTGSGH